VFLFRLFGKLTLLIFETFHQQKAGKRERESGQTALAFNVLALAGAAAARGVSTDTVVTWSRHHVAESRLRHSDSSQKRSIAKFKLFASQSFLKSRYISVTDIYQPQPHASKKKRKSSRHYKSYNILYHV